MVFGKVAISSLLLASLFAGISFAAVPMPPEEDAIKDTVDHWGLPFSDQFRLYQDNFANYAKAAKLNNPKFAIGVTSSLQKTFHNKYWFKGNWANELKLQAGRNESEGFQLAIMPKTGEALEGIKIVAGALKSADGKSEIPASAIKLWRVGFVKTAKPQYPVRHIGDWPDPLLKLSKPFELKGLKLGLIWCEIKVPTEAKPGNYTGKITITATNAKPQSLTVKLRVWNFTLPNRIQWPTMVWISGNMKSPAYLELCSLFLEHHVDPITVGRTADLALLDKNLKFCLERGQMFFQTVNFSPKHAEAFKKYYDHIKQKGWLDKALIYGAQDEPTQEQLDKIVIPRTKLIKKNYPGLKTFLASEYHPGLGDGTDIWLTDLSTKFGSWLKAGRPGSQEMWMYFCHLPIRIGYERPLVDAPNMQIDNDAIEHRVLNWMAWDYGAKGNFIWAGNCSWPKGYDGNPDKAYPLTTKLAKHPYAGIHNGNGFLVYPGNRPSIRLKVLRDGIEDYWYLTQIKKLAEAGNADAKKLLDNIKPEVFVNTHYFNKNPNSLMKCRNKLGEFLSKGASQ